MGGVYAVVGVVTAVSAFLAFAITVAFMFSLRPVAEAVGLIDMPGGRKRHESPVPVIGGVAMAIGIGFGSTFLLYPAFWSTVLLAMVLLVTIGTIDDRFDLPASTRLIAQVCAALLVTFGAEVRIADLGAPFFTEGDLGIAAAPFTVLFIVTLINGFNVIDGLDGLAGGLALVAFSVLALLGFGATLGALAVLMAAAVAAFLLFNLPVGFNRSQRSFMGDAGSTSLGLIVACLGIQFTQGGDALIAPVVGLWLVAVPVFDLFAAAIRRVMEGKSPFAPDHEHLHHALVVAGLSRRMTLLVMLSFGVACASIGVLGHLMALPDGVLLLGWVAAGVLYYQAMRRPAFLVRHVTALEVRVRENVLGTTGQV